MAGRLNWEGASRADRMRRSGTESVYTGTSGGAAAGGSDIANYAFEQAAVRYTKQIRKERKKAAAQAALEEQRKARRKASRKAARQRNLEQYTAEANNTIWDSVQNPRWEHVILCVDRLLMAVNRKHQWRKSYAAAHAAVVTYMEALRAEIELDNQSELAAITFVSHIKNAPSDIVGYITRRVQKCGAKDRATLYRQMDISMAKFGQLSNASKDVVVLRLGASRVLVVTPGDRVLYYARHQQQASN